MREIVFFLEEQSAEAMLIGLLPRILPADVCYRCVVFEGKRDLESQLVRRIRGYRVPHARFVVLRDQDAEDCRVVKAHLARLCNEAGRAGSMIRVACRELESWYLGDLKAVEMGLHVAGLARLQDKRLYRDPDVVQSPARQLRRIAPSYQKVGGSRAIGPYLDPENSRSKSFVTFVEGIRRIVNESS